MYGKLSINFHVTSRLRFYKSSKRVRILCVGLSINSANRPSGSNNRVQASRNKTRSRNNRVEPRSIEKRSFSGESVVKRKTVSGKGCSNALRVADNFIGNRACTLQPANANYLDARQKDLAIEMLYTATFREAKARV